MLEDEIMGNPTYKKLPRATFLRTLYYVREGVLYNKVTRHGVSKGSPAGTLTKNIGGSAWE